MAHVLSRKKQRRNKTKSRTPSQTRRRDHNNNDGHAKDDHDIDDDNERNNKVEISRLTVADEAVVGRSQVHPGAGGHEARQHHLSAHRNGETADKQTTER